MSFINGGPRATMFHLYWPNGFRHGSSLTSPLFRLDMRKHPWAPLPLSNKHQTCIDILPAIMDVHQDLVHKES